VAELSDAEKKELQQKASEGEQLRDLTNHPGWTGVLLPRLKKLRGNLIQQMLTQKLDLVGFQMHQQSINAIDNLLGGIDNAIIRGDAAREKLKSE